MHDPTSHLIPPNKRWQVTSPKYSYVEPVLDDGSGPTFDARNYAEVIAPTKREAKILAVRAWRSGHVTPLVSVAEGNMDYCEGTNPFTGLKAEVLTPCPRDGYNYEECEEGVCIPYICVVCEEDIELGTERPLLDEEFAHEFCALPLEDRVSILLGDYFA